MLKGEFYGAFVLYTLLSIGIGLAATLAGGYVGKQI
jgi:CrcB protein